MELPELVLTGYGRKKYWGSAISTYNINHSILLNGFNAVRGAWNRAVFQANPLYTNLGPEPGGGSLMMMSGDMFGFSDLIGLGLNRVSEDHPYAAIALGMVAIVATKGKAADDVLKMEANGAFYSIAYEMKLAKGSYPGVTRYMHFKEANIALESELLTNPALNELGIIIPRSPAGSIIGKSPTNWVWHHDIEKGLMQLVPKSQHPNVPGGIFWETLHPGKKGGFSIWGKK